ncbi:unnamed protein product [Ceutorhynchus assimilis]|uniref:Enkurin domain-containing protein n=1 Tax=Ceutorhynchus assimilis TaxID=467358 RepID=A0A9N9MCD8_9CUCU|nr:unnamed protein product [Ceutorhynchus assimilis]
MSIIYITNHDETIFNITQGQMGLQKKASRYKAKFREQPDIPLHVYARTHKAHATMGVAEEEPPNPQNYLRKSSGKPSYTSKTPQKEKKMCRKMMLPHKSETPFARELICAHKIHKKNVHSTKNFIKDNVTFVRNMKAKEPEHKVVVDKAGTVIQPEAGGLEPVYIKKSIFGQAPNYLKKLRKLQELEYRMKKDHTGNRSSSTLLNCKCVTEDEREQLLRGLKQNWEELQKIYQRLPIFTDTIPKKNKKAKLEADLKQLENDITLLEKHPYVYVYDDTI